MNDAQEIIDSYVKHLAEVLGEDNVSYLDTGERIEVGISGKSVPALFYFNDNRASQLEAVRRYLTGCMHVLTALRGKGKLEQIG